MSDLVPELSKKTNPSNASGVLAYIYETIVKRLIPNGERKSSIFSTLLDKFCTDPTIISRYDDRTKLTTFRGNLVRRLTGDSLSWKMFITGLRVLRIPKFDIKFTIYVTPTRTEEFEFTVNLAGVEHDTDLDDREE